MKVPNWLPAFGDMDFRGKCPPESAEQVTFFNMLRREYPDTYGKIALHPRNEGKRTAQQTQREKSEGLATGASDVVIPCNPPIIIEMKRQDHTQSTWEKGQQAYLWAAKQTGAHVCVAFGWEAAWRAFEKYSCKPEK